MNKIKNNNQKDENIISMNDNIQLNNNNKIQGKKAQNTQNIYKNPLKEYYKTSKKIFINEYLNNYQNNDCNYTMPSSQIKKYQTYLNENLNITPIKNEFPQLNNTFPNQQLINQNSYNENNEKNNISYNIIRNNKTKEEILYETEYNVKMRKDEKLKLIKDKKS